MRRSLRYLVCGVMLVWGQSAVSQGFVFDTTDVNAIYGVGNVITVHHDSLVASAYIGAPGQWFWDFINLGTNSVTSLVSVPVASTPYAADFPQARFALYDAAFTYSFYSAALQGIVTLVGTGYYYYGMGEGLFNFGFKGSGDAYLSGYPYAAHGQWLNSPASEEYALPLQLSTTWTTNYTESIGGNVSTGLGTLPFGPYSTTHSVTYTVDAFGALALPGGQVRNAVRIRRADSFVSSTESGLRVSYIVLAENGAMVRMTMVDPSATSGEVDVTDVQWSLGREDLPVPIELASFRVAGWDGGGVTLEWTTVSETRNFGFFVQRRGSGETGFTDLAGSFVAGHGTTVVPQRYSYCDRTGGAEACWYRLKQVDLDGTLHFSEPIQVGAAAKAPLPVPDSHELAQNYPNPCNPTTTIRYGIPERAHVLLTVYDAIGQRVAVLQEGEVDKGYHEVTFDASGLASGVYFYRLTVGYPSSVSPGDKATGVAPPGVDGSKTSVQTRKMLVLR